MKKSFVFLILMLLCGNIFGQSFGRDDSLRLIKEIDVAAQNLKTKLDDGNDFLNDDEKNFIVDTFKIERFCDAQMQLDYSNAGMANACYRAEIEYDNLMKKIYERLMETIAAADKKQLAATQQKWLAWRNDERALGSKLITYPQGTMYFLAAAERYLDITKTRALNLFFYLQQVLTAIDDEK